MELLSTLLVFCVLEMKVKQLGRFCFLFAWSFTSESVNLGFHRVGHRAASLRSQGSVMAPSLARCNSFTPRLCLVRPGGGRTGRRGRRALGIITEANELQFRKQINTL